MLGLTNDFYRVKVALTAGIARGGESSAVVSGGSLSPWPSAWPRVSQGGCVHFSGGDRLVFIVYRLVVAWPSGGPAEHSFRHRRRLVVWHAGVYGCDWVRTPTLIA